jgi:hypothetical protein
VKLDMLGEEIQFVDHLAPIWLALPVESRGRFMTHFTYLTYARSLGIDATTATRDGGEAILVASLGDMRRAQAMGFTRIARIEHGIGQSYAGDTSHPMATHASYAGGEGARMVGLFLVPNEHSAKRWQSAYPNARVEIVGCPKLDNPPAYEPSNPPIVGISFHWNWHILPETRSAFEQYRTAVVALSKTHTVLGHAHPKAAPLVSRWFAREGIPYAEHFSEIAAKAAVFVADNTSSLYEFAALGRPVVVLNVPTVPGQPGYRREVEQGLRFWAASGVGVNCETPRDLTASVDRALADPPEQQAAREAALDIVYAYRTGAADRAAGALLDWLAQQSEPRALAAVGAMSPNERVEAYRAAV